MKPILEIPYYYKFEEGDADNIIQALSNGMSYNMYELGEIDGISIRIDEEGIQVVIVQKD